MNWYYFLGTLIFAAIGYLIGSFSTAIVVSKILKNEDVRDKGSGNAGATNTLRNYGKKLGLFVFIIDMMKVVIVVVFAFLVKKYSNIELFKGIIIPVVALFVVIGHIWTIFFNFKGGKGAACFVGFYLAAEWSLFLIGFVTFFAIFFMTRKVSLGSLITPLIIIIIQIIFNFLPGYSRSIAAPLLTSPWWVTTIVSVIIYGLLIIKHIPNIKRLISGTENKIKMKKRK